MFLKKITYFTSPLPQVYKDEEGRNNRETCLKGYLYGKTTYISTNMIISISTLCPDIAHVNSSKQICEKLTCENTWNDVGGIMWNRMVKTHAKNHIQNHVNINELCKNVTITELYVKITCKVHKSRVGGSHVKRNESCVKNHICKLSKNV